MSEIKKDDSLVYVEATNNDLPEEISDNEVVNMIMEEAASLFTDLSILMSKVMVALGEETDQTKLGMFPEIAGSALLAQLNVVMDSIKDDIDGLEIIDKIGYALGQR